MLIAQITDVHLGFDGDDEHELNQKRFDRVLDELVNGRNRPDLLIVSGDLADKGAPESYARIADALRACPFPAWPMVGNHDVRATFSAAFPQVPMPGGFVQYCLPLDGLRLIVLDTLEEGRHGGAFCETRAAWLAERLNEQRDVPTILVMHHPPFDAGIAWMSTHPGEPWVARFAAAIAGHDQIRAIWCGHLHRAVVAPWKGVTISVCPATAVELTLDLNPIDPDRPDNRPMINADAPGYALHRWTGEGLVTHFDTVQDRLILARFDEAMQPLVRHVTSERPV